MKVTETWSFDSSLSMKTAGVITWGLPENGETDVDSRARHRRIKGYMIALMPWEC